MIFLKNMEFHQKLKSYKDLENLKIKFIKKKNYSNKL